jgi:ribosomal protein L37AE/L43A
VHAKVTAIDEAVRVKEWNKQDVTIADSSGSLKLVAWEDAVGKLNKGQSYSFTAATVKLYADETFLSLGPRSQFVETADIGVVDNSPLSSSGQDSRTIIISVIGVKEIRCYPCCPSCKGRVEVEENGIATCGKCHMTVSGTSYSVHFLAEDRGGETHEMTAFERTITTAFPSIKFEDVAEKLLNATFLKIVVGNTATLYIQCI